MPSMKHHSAISKTGARLRLSIRRLGESRLPLPFPRAFFLFSIDHIRSFKRWKQTAKSSWREKRDLQSQLVWEGKHCAMVIKPPNGQYEKSARAYTIVLNHRLESDWLRMEHKPIRHEGRLHLETKGGCHSLKSERSPRVGKHTDGDALYALSIMASGSEGKFQLVFFFPFPFLPYTSTFLRIAPSFSDFFVPLE